MIGPGLSSRGVCNTYPGFELGPLAPRSQFLVLDEPTAGLDPDAREDLQRVLRDLLLEGPEVSILLSSHIFGIAPATLIFAAKTRSLLEAAFAELSLSTASLPPAQVFSVLALFGTRSPTGWPRSR